MKKINNWKIGWLILGVLFLSGCASVQIVGNPPSFKSLPSVVAIGDITPANEKVQIPPEEIKEGQKILYETFKKELPEFTVVRNIRDLQQGTEDYLLVKTNIRMYHEAQPEMALTVVFAMSSQSAMEAEMIVVKHKGDEDLFKLHAAATGGCIWGKNAAYRANLEGMAKKLAGAIKRYAGK
jgi:hypothetical protein